MDSRGAQEDDLIMEEVATNQEESTRMIVEGHLVLQQLAFL
jgi:hypothetical protein